MLMSRKWRGRFVCSTLRVSFFLRVDFVTVVEEEAIVGRGCHLGSDRYSEGGEGFPVGGVE